MGARVTGETEGARPRKRKRKRSRPSVSIQIFIRFAHSARARVSERARALFAMSRRRRRRTGPLLCVWRGTDTFFPFFSENTELVWRARSGTKRAERKPPHFGQRALGGGERPIQPERSAWFARARTHSLAQFFFSFSFSSLPSSAPGLSVSLLTTRGVHACST